MDPDDCMETGTLIFYYHGGGKRKSLRCGMGGGFHKGIPQRRKRGMISLLPVEGKRSTELEETKKKRRKKRELGDSGREKDAPPRCGELEGKKGGPPGLHRRKRQAEGPIQRMW